MTISHTLTRPSFPPPPARPPRAVEYLSLWYNAETTANEVSSSVIERLSCTQSIVNAAAAVRKAAAVRQGLPVPVKPKVLWAYNYGACMRSGGGGGGGGGWGSGRTDLTV
jgi:hypothetical protein